MDFVVIINYYIIYSFFGWVLESIYKSLHEKKFINSGFLAGPFCPIYGYGALIMYFFLDGFKDNLFLLFIIAFFILSFWEYIVGYFLEVVFKTKYWDYSKKKFNIHGRVCLENSIYWGVLGIVFIELIHPGVESLIKVIPNNFLTIVTGIAFAYIAIDTIITTIKLIRVNIKVSALEDITDKLEKMLPNLKEIKSVNKNTVLRGIARIRTRNRLAFSELNNRRIELLNKIDKQTKRIRRAFPSMKSDYLELPYGVTINNTRNRVRRVNTEDREKE